MVEVARHQRLLGDDSIVEKGNGKTFFQLLDTGGMWTLDMLQLSRIVQGIHLLRVEKDHFSLIPNGALCASIDGCLMGRCLPQVTRCGTRCNINAAPTTACIRTPMHSPNHSPAHNTTAIIINSTSGITWWFEVVVTVIIISVLIGFERR